MSISGTQERKKEHRVSAPSARILVVDNSKDCADSLCVLLTILGYEALAVYDGLQAVEKTKSFCPDVVVLNIGLPGIDGREVARRFPSCTEMSFSVPVSSAKRSRCFAPAETYSLNPDISIPSSLLTSRGGK